MKTVEPERTVTEEEVNPSNPSVGPDPLGFEHSIRPRSSYTKTNDPRSIALAIAMTGLPCVLGTIVG